MATYYTNKSGSNTASRVFVVSGIVIIPIIGATYTNNAQTFTVEKLSTDSLYLFVTGAGAPQASGILTLASGTGDATIAFSSTTTIGLQPYAAKLTIQSAATAAATNDTIIVGSGLYNEKISITKTLTLSADGVVVLDGSNLSYSNAIIFNVSVSSTLTITSTVTNGIWIIQNHAGSSLLFAQGAGSGSFTISNCIFLSNNNTYAVYNPNSYGAVNVTNCVFSRFSYGLNIIGNGQQNPYIQYCTFYSCTIGTYINNTSSPCVILLCIFSNCTTAWDTDSITYINDNLYYTITNWKIGVNTYTTLAQVQAVNANYDSRSLVADPQFTDATNNIFYLKSQSAVSPYVGMYPYSFTQAAANDSLGTWNIAASADNTGWYNPESNILKDGTTGYFYLSTGTTGTLYSPVYDIGSIQSISQVNLSKSEYWPYCMVDTINTDVRPNKQTIELRASISTFTQDSSAVTWYEIRSDIPFSPMTGQYTQVRLIFRTNDVGA